MCLYFLVPGAMTGLHIRFVADHEDQISCINIIFYRVNTILHFTQCSAAPWHCYKHSSNIKKNKG